MPVAKGGRTPARQALLIGIGALCGLAAVVFLVTRFDQLSAEDDAEVELGDPVFSVGEASDLAELIAENGPLLLPDAARGNRDVWVHHLGDGPDRDWVAFAVRPPGAPRECFVDWRASDSTFIDTCDGTIYPQDGTGLEQYAVSVDPEGDLTINLSPLEAPGGG